MVGMGMGLRVGGKMVGKGSEMKYDTVLHTPKSKRRKQVRSNCLEIFLRIPRDACCLPLG